MNDYVIQSNIYTEMVSDNYFNIDMYMVYNRETMTWSTWEEKKPDTLSPKKSLERMKFGMEK